MEQTIQGGRRYIIKVVREMATVTSVATIYDGQSFPAANRAVELILAVLGVSRGTAGVCYDDGGRLMGLYEVTEGVAEAKLPLPAPVILQG